MSAQQSFDEALDAAIDAVVAGEPIEVVLARFASQSAALRPVLETAVRATQDASARTLPMSPALADNYTIVRAAVERAQLAERPDAAEDAVGRRAPWWQRRLTFASLTLPAGAFALLALAGVSGAAAASIAATPDLRSAVVDFVASPHVPDLSSSDDGGGGHDGASSPRGVAGETVPAAGAVASPTRASDNRPTHVTLTGTIADLHGNVFTLKMADGETKVNIDGGTQVTGVLADGAAASVTGDLTAEKNLHADSVAVTAPPANPANPDATPTPHGNADQKTATPASEHTPGSQPDHTPRSQSGDHTPGAEGERGGSPTSPANQGP
jgi:hypothetical protein